MAKHLFLTLFTLLLTVNPASALLSDYCNYPSPGDTFSEVPSRYNVQGNDWNKAQCILDGLVSGGGGGGTDTTCNDAGVTCLFAGSASEGGPATTATALTANGANCSPGNYPLGVDASGAVESCTAVGAGLGDVVGPASSTNSDLACFDGATGKLLKDCGTNVPTATALAANGGNCSAGSYPLGVDASGAVESCTVAAVDTDTTCLDAGVVCAYAGSATEGGVATSALTATNADNLTVDPTDCGVNTFATSIDRQADLTCTQPAFSNLIGSATDAQIPNDITITYASNADNVKLLGNSSDTSQYLVMSTDLGGVGAYGPLRSNSGVYWDGTANAIVSPNFEGNATSADTALTATALVSNPTDCIDGLKADGITANGTATCTSNGLFSGASNVWTPTGSTTGPTTDTYVDMFDGAHNAAPVVSTMWYEVKVNAILVRTAGAGTVYPFFTLTEASSATIGQSYCTWDAYWWATTSPTATSAWTLTFSGGTALITEPANLTLGIAQSDTTSAYKMDITCFIKATATGTVVPQLKWSTSGSITSAVNWGSYWTIKPVADSFGIME